MPDHKLRDGIDRKPKKGKSITGKQNTATWIRVMMEWEKCVERTGKTARI